MLEKMMDMALAWVIGRQQQAFSLTVVGCMHAALSI